MTILTRTLLALVVLFALMTPAATSAGPGGCTGFAELQPFAFEQITISSTALGYTATVYAPAGTRPADMAVVSVETNAVRYRDDGLNPTASVGSPIAAATTYMTCGNLSVQRIRFIRQTSDATLSVAYYRATQ